MNEPPTALEPLLVQRMMPATERLHSAIVARRLTLPQDPELARHAANDGEGLAPRLAPERAGRPGAHDGIVGLVMAVERAEVQARAGGAARDGSRVEMGAPPRYRVKPRRGAQLRRYRRDRLISYETNDLGP